MTHKREKLKNILFAGLCLLSVDMFGQNTDSLENILNNRKLSTEEYLNVCDDLSWYYLDGDFGKSRKYAMMGIGKAKSDHHPSMEAKLYRNLGVAYYMNSQMDSAQIFLDISLARAVKTDDKELEAAVYGAIGNMHNVSGNHREALTHYLKALSMFELQANKERVRSLLGNIGTLYYSMMNIGQAEKYFLALEKESVEAGDMYNLGRAYDGLSRVVLKRKDFDASLQYSLLAADIFHRNGHKSAEAIALQGIAMVYYLDYKDYTKAKEYALKALELTKEIGYKSDIAGSLNILSNICFNEKDYVNCFQSAVKALETDTADAAVTSNLYANIVRSGVFLKNPQEILPYFDKYRTLIDKRSTHEFEQSMAELEKKYQTEKKELRIAALEKERILSVAIFLTGIISLLLFLLVLYLRHRAIKIGKSVADQEILRLEKENQLIATQAVLEGETQERARLSRDLHDGLGGMLSAVKLNLFDVKQSVVIEAEDVLRFNRVMEMLDNSMQELRRVAHNMMPETLSRYGLKVALDDFCKNFRNVTFHFFGKEDRIGQKIEEGIYRIAIELINNSLKHSGASTINVQLIRGDDLISLNVQDNGKGFDVTAETTGSGLHNISTRVASLNGTMNIYSNPEEGSEIDVEIRIQ